MKVGDFVKDVHPFGKLPAKTGVVITQVKSSRATNKVFMVLWFDGTVGNNVWDYDLKVVNESR